MPSKADLIHAVECRNTLGEGVLWDEQTSTAIWTDIEGRALYRSRFPFEDYERFPAPERIGCIGLLQEGPRGELAAAFESGFALYGMESGHVQWIHRPAIPPGSRFNDGRVDREGVFWAGTMIEDPRLAKGETGSLYRLSGGQRAEQVIEDIRIPNSLCWSPDGTVMYFADTPRDLIWAFDMRDGEPCNRRVFAETSDGGHPDGSTVDAEGFLWNAQWGAGRVVRYTPDGRMDLAVPVPAPHVSCVTFGGPDLAHLLVTSARAELDQAALTAAPQSGNLFVYETDFRGLPESRCSLHQNAA